MPHCENHLKPCAFIAPAEAEEGDPDVSPMKQSFEQVYMRTLRHLYDTETQLTVSLAALRDSALDPEFLAALRTIESQSATQLERLAEVFRVLYQNPRGEASWVATALLREAWEASVKNGDGTECCAQALLALKRYELTLYEGLLHWSERCDLFEVLPSIRKSMAEELLQTTILSGFAFETRCEAPIEAREPCVLH